MIYRISIYLGYRKRTYKNEFTYKCMYPLCFLWIFVPYWMLCHMCQWFRQHRPNLIANTNVDTIFFFKLYCLLWIRSTTLPTCLASKWRLWWLNSWILHRYIGRAFYCMYTLIWRAFVVAKLSRKLATV